MTHTAGGRHFAAAFTAVSSSAPGITAPSLSGSWPSTCMQAVTGHGCYYGAFVAAYSNMAGKKLCTNLHMIMSAILLLAVLGRHHTSRRLCVTLLCVHAVLSVLKHSMSQQSINHHVSCSSVYSR